MFLLLINNQPVQQSMEIQPILNRLGFLNNNQYYNYKKGKIKNKFKHLGQFEIINIEQKQFFQDNMLVYDKLQV